MSEITKLYENCNIKPKQEGYCDWDSNCPYPRLKCNDECPYWKDEDEANYPPFTAEKQLKLIKWLILNDFVDELDIFYRPFELMWVFKIYNVPEFANEKSACRMGADMTFEKGLASLINNLWQSLTEEEKQQVKGILE